MTVRQEVLDTLQNGPPLFDVIIAGDDELVLNGVRDAIARDHDIAAQIVIAGQRDMSRLLALPRPDLFIVCCEFITTETVDLLCQLSLIDSSARVPMLVLTGNMSELMPALFRHGLCVITRKRVPPRHLAAMAQLVGAGYLPVPRDDVVELLADRDVLDRRDETRNNLVQKLTRREREVFELISRGMTNSQIADALSIARSTVKSHVESILAKLGLRGRIEIMLHTVTGHPSGPTDCVVSDYTWQEPVT